ncbi:hypothetical protein [Streptomyces minutiscleroticus]|uniref:hypothetical protein n=1 Tax=Streptomyces minutiscleroticus TaxID=68238 RepID=UPI003319913C
MENFTASYFKAFRELLTKREVRGRRSITLVTVCAVPMLLTACGNSNGESKVAALGERQTKAVVPDALAMPGWKVIDQPEAYPITNFSRVGLVLCTDKETKACKGSRFVGTSIFSREKTVQAAFWALAYRDEEAASAAYDAQWGHYKDGLGKPAKLDLDGLGARSDAQVGIGSRSDEVAIAQVQVGTVILWANVSDRDENGLSKSFVKDIAAVFTERVQQAQNGDTPSAGLRSE